MEISVKSLAPQSKVWIYQLDRPLQEEEKDQVNEQLTGFVAQWTAHSRALKAIGRVYYDRFVVLMVDETQEPASGCSIDTSVHFLQELEKEFNIRLFDRLTIAYRENGHIQTASQEAFQQLWTDQKINDETVVFNNLVETKAQFDTAWEIPLQQSWHKRLLDLA